MNALSRPLHVQTCPHCRSAIGPSEFVCRSCSGIVPIERGAHWVRSRISEERRRVGGFLRDHRVLIWLLALIPLALAPPIAALAIVFTAREPDGTRRDPTLVATVAILNIVVSIVAWHHLAAFVFGLWPAIWRLILDYGPHPAVMRGATPI